jgi:hypothetical protein
LQGRFHAEHKHARSKKEIVDYSVESIDAEYFDSDDPDESLLAEIATMDSPLSILLEKEDKEIPSEQVSLIFKIIEQFSHGKIRAYIVRLWMDGFGYSEIAEILNREENEWTKEIRYGRNWNSKAIDNQINAIWTFFRGKQKRIGIKRKRKTKEEKKEYQKKYILKNQAKIAAYQEKYREQRRLKKLAAIGPDKKKKQTPEERKARIAAYQEKHREKIREYNRNYMKAKRIENQTGIIVHQKRTKQSKEELKQKRKLYYEKNRERLRAKAKEYAKTHKRSQQLLKVYAPVE